MTSDPRTPSSSPMTAAQYARRPRSLFDLFDYSFEFIKIFQHVLHKAFIGLTAFFAQG